VYYDVLLVEGEGINFSKAVLDTATAPENVWRDTVFIQNLVFARIYQRFGGGDIARTGKIVFHCHFRDREDQGMISAIMIGDPNLVATDIQPTDSPLSDSFIGAVEWRDLGCSIRSQHPTLYVYDAVYMDF
jgi:hypothetical protein